MMLPRFSISLILLLLTAYSIEAQKAEITLQKIWKSGEFAARGVSGISSMNDGLHYTSDVRNQDIQYIIRYAYADGNAVDTLFSSKGLKTFDGKPFNFSSYEFNNDESRLILASEEESIYRHSSRAYFYSCDVGNNNITPVTDFSKGKQELASLSPVANKVAFVRANNIFINDLDTKVELQITFDGKWAHIINGALDWVYEEEFSFHRGFYWSPEGDRIAYYRFDETEVPEFNMTMYTGLYPSLYNFKYPKAGERNSMVQVFVYELAKNSSREVEIGANAEQYIPRIAWTRSPGKLCVMRMNRHQSHLEFLLADATLSGNTISTKTIYSEKAETYIDINDNLIFLEGGKYFIWNSEKDGWNHIYIFDVQGNEVAQLTRGTWEVTEFYGVDQKSGLLYFSASMNGPLSTAVYSTSFSGALKSYEKLRKTVIPAADTRKAHTLLTPNNNSNRADFSKSFRYFINSESGSGTPPFIALWDNSGKKIRDLEVNSTLRTNIDKYNITPVEFSTFKTTIGHELHYSIIKPVNFDPAKEYPMILMVYGGPGSNRVANRWGGSDFFWHQMLAQNGYIVVSVDPRGTMHRGRDFKHSTYLQLGKLETEDFIETAKYFGALNYVDSNRIGIMGWSYGGYMSSLCMTKGADYFKLGIAVAPVTNWRFYDSIYTERFLRTPQENPLGYDENSPINFVDKMKGHFLLVHGSADDNVHYQNTMEMIKALVKADKHFDLYIYPDKNHGIYGGNTRYHLYTKMTDFILQNL
jgi:dipeptidyl-peptidase-4